MGKIQLFDFRNFFKGYPLFLQELYKKTPGKNFFPRCSLPAGPQSPAGEKYGIFGVYFSISLWLTTCSL